MSSQRFKDQVAFVTGGTSGLGAATAQCFIDEGAKVFIADLEERPVMKQFGPNATFMKCDVSSPEDCEAAIKACIEKWGRLDVLFHGAARSPPVTTVVDHDVAVFQQIINTNLCSAFYLARIAIPQMRKQGKGAIVNVASTSAFTGDHGLCSYNAAKGGIMSLTRAMAVDHTRDGIRINSICPGLMNTAMSGPMLDHAEFQAEVQSRVLQGKSRLIISWE